MTVILKMCSDTIHAAIEYVGNDEYIYGDHITPSLKVRSRRVALVTMS